MKLLNKYLKQLLIMLDVTPIRYSEYKKMMNDIRQDSNAKFDLEFLKYINSDKSSELINLFEHSQSQLRQDLFVLNELNFKKNGFFIEFGATNGIELSNTYLLEKKFSWKGILSEPAKCWHYELSRNRNCTITHECVWSKSNLTLEFSESVSPELSSISSIETNDYHSENRKSGEQKYSVRTISLIDLLEKNNAPEVIDYLSIDTEGSEFEILSAIDFNKYKFSVITCEHNYTEQREKIFQLLTSAGYRRVFENISKYDDWYIYDCNF